MGAGTADGETAVVRRAGECIGSCRGKRKKLLGLLSPFSNMQPRQKPSAFRFKTLSAYKSISKTTLSPNPFSRDAPNLVLKRPKRYPQILPK